MAIKTTDAPTLTQKLNTWFNEGARDGISDWVGKDIYDVQSTDWEVFNTLTLYGLGRPSRGTEGAQFASLETQEGDSKSFTQKSYNSRIGVTKHMRLFERYDQIKPMVQTMVEGAFDSIDQAHADLLTNGFAGSSYTDVFGESQSNLANDGVVLFSASHTNNINADTASNLIANSSATANPALDRDPIVTTVAAGRKYKDPNGLNRPAKLDRLYVSATNYDLAQRIVYSTGVQGTPNVDSNPLRGDVNALKMWSRIDTDAAGNDRSARWFMCDSRKVTNSLRSPFAQRPMMYAPEEINDSKTWEYTMDFFFSMGADVPKFIHGSTGSN